MKSITVKAAASLMAVFLFASCANPAGTGTTGGNGNENTVKTKYTVTFDDNCPSGMENGNYYFCSQYAPSAETAEEGSSITLPSFSGELIKYVNNTEEGVYPFESWNTLSDGTGDSYTAGAAFQVTKNCTLYAVYSAEKKSSGVSASKPDGDYLDPSTTSSYEMKVGDKIQLYVENAQSYTVTSGEDIVSIDSDNVLEAVSPGSATVKVTITDSIQTYSVVITVSADATNTNHDSALMGKWVDGESYLQFNSDGTGYLYFVSGSLKSLDSSCTWETTTGEKPSVIISGAPSSNNGSYQYVISGTKLMLYGRMAFGMASPSTWTKEE